MIEVILGVFEKEFQRGKASSGRQKCDHDHNHRDFPEHAARLAPSLTLQAGCPQIHLKEMMTTGGASFATIASSCGGASVFHERAANDRSAILQQSDVKSSPMAAAALGRRLVSVMPGMVLISRTVGPVVERRTSTLL